MRLILGERFQYTGPFLQRDVFSNLIYIKKIYRQRIVVIYIHTHKLLIIDDCNHNYVYMQKCINYQNNNDFLEWLAYIETYTRTHSLIFCSKQSTTHIQIFPCSDYLPLGKRNSRASNHSRRVASVHKVRNGSCYLACRTARREYSYQLLCTQQRSTT